ncbi:MAG TPA: DUF2304 domain-containing protein [Thermoanaerobaculia bacterium]|nr:DUF2304 domain-containing protein [Thermoanaerobaculia bacterium]
MWTIKAILIGGSALLFFYFFVVARGRPVEKIGMSLVFLSIAFFSAFPELSDRVANLVGVDRGADLMLYFSTMALLFLCFNLYLRQRQIQSELVRLARELALLGAREAATGPAAPRNETNRER